MKNNEEHYKNTEEQSQAVRVRGQEHEEHFRLYIGGVCSSVLDLPRTLGRCS